MAQFRVKRNRDGSYSVTGFKYSGKQLDQIAQETAKDKAGVGAAFAVVAESLNPTKKPE